MIAFDSPAVLASRVGEALGPGDWTTVTQEMIDRFADATGDRQWIHVDVERARREAPDGKTIAHGYLLLSLLGVLQPTIYTVKASRILNYGINRLRFLAPVPSGARVRLSETVKAAEPVSGGLRIATEATIELEGAPKPALIAEIVFLYFD
ncbi:MaoC family dehydratase [Chelatococcus reniformis]|uniref:Enoyl-CoA hydratase 1 n=1 Tax=Chelatococcus reniformis TaxID=1494448 RepID=A0A916UMC0_9HYPH|nr:MaoC family dehydratase [Chelatococcus reniformis]GGC78139.1 putative enoyl-CoA hydratase 1 [Chelatococcus reniformis]